jgi:serine/threonine-protein kinase
VLELPSGVPFIVMDLLEGEPLSARLRRGKLDLEATLLVMRPTIDAVAAAHELGVVHRDLKPDNVFLERAPQGKEVVRVLDFGIAKRFDVGTDADASGPQTDPRATPPSSSKHASPLAGRSLTTTFSALGTPVYMSPEQLRRDRDVGAEADVWALGMLTYECLTGERPPRDETTSGVVIDRARAALPRDLPAPVAGAVLRMMSVDPSERPTLAEVEAIFAARPATSLDARVRPSGWGRTTYVMAALAGLLATVLVVRSLRSGGEPVRTVPEPTAAANSMQPGPPSPPTVATATVAPAPVPSAVVPAPPVSLARTTKAADPRNHWPTVVKSAKTIEGQASPPTTVTASPTSTDAIPSFERK